MYLIFKYSYAIVMADENQEYTREELAKVSDYLLKYGVDAATAGNMVNDFNYIEEIYAWAVFSYDRVTNLIRGSIRSRGPIINEVASNYNGGGHIYASGVRVKDFDIIDLLIDDLNEVCKYYKKEKNN